MLALSILFSFAGAALLALWPRERVEGARWAALGCVGAGLLCALAEYLITYGGVVRVYVDLPWIPSMGVRCLLLADGLSRTLALLTGLASVAGVLMSWNLERRVHEYFALYLALLGGVYGVFLSGDVFLFLVFYEIAIVPKYFLIAIWGSTRREHGAMKLALYSFGGSALALLGLVAAYAEAGSRSTVLSDLAQANLSPHFQMWAFPLVFLGFAVLAGLWPFHGWAPTGHVAAPTAASMLLAGVVMKLGAYGCLRVAMGLFPRGMDPWGVRILGLGSWRDLFAMLALIGIVYGALAALGQRDFKYVIGFSSVSHMGYVLLGLLTLNRIGLDGAVLQMVSHGLLAGALFAIVGRLVYDRTHTRDLDELGAMHLLRRMPLVAVAFVVAGYASFGGPPFSGFLAELQVIAGTWRAAPGWTLGAGLGVVLCVAYTWRALQKVFFGEARPTADDHPKEGWRDMAAITWPEYAGLGLLLGSSLLVGLFPRLLLEQVEPAVRTLLAGGAQ